MIGSGFVLLGKQTSDKWKHSFSINGLSEPNWVWILFLIQQKGKYDKFTGF